MPERIYSTDYMLHVNGWPVMVNESKCHNGQELTQAQVIALAKLEFASIDEAAKVQIRVSYTNDLHDESGILLPNQSVRIRNGTTFHVSKVHG